MQITFILNTQLVNNKSELMKVFFCYDTCLIRGQNILRNIGGSCTNLPPGSSVRFKGVFFLKQTGRQIYAVPMRLLTKESGAVGWHVLSG